MEKEFKYKKSRIHKCAAFALAMVLSVTSILFTTYQNLTIKELSAAINRTQESITSRSSSATGNAIAAIPIWIEIRTQLSTSNGWGWPSWASSPERKSMWAGHRPLWRGSKTGSASSSVEAQSHSAAGRIPLRELWEYVKYGYQP